MKRIVNIAVFMISVMVLASCNQKKLENQQSQIDSLRLANEALIQQNTEKEANLTEFFETMAQIRSNLDEIKARQNIISNQTGGTEQVTADMRQNINNDLTAIGKLMDDNRRRINSLNRQLRESNVKVGELEKIVASLTLEVEARNVEIAQLRENMNQLNIHNQALTEAIEKLDRENREQMGLIADKTEQLNTAYFTYGTRRQLLDQEIIVRQGGVLGLGRTTAVNSNASKDLFTRIDVTQVETFDIPSDKLQIVSTHPTGSYQINPIDDQSSQIVVTDRTQFWSNTRYLVVNIE